MGMLLQATDQRGQRTNSSGGGDGGVMTPTFSRVASATADNLMFALTPPTVGAFRCAQTFGGKGPFDPVKGRSVNKTLCADFSCGEVFH